MTACRAEGVHDPCSKNKPNSADNRRMADLYSSPPQESTNRRCFLIGDVPVQVQYAENGVTLADALLSYFTALKQD